MATNDNPINNNILITTLPPNIHRIYGPLQANQVFHSKL